MVFNDWIQRKLAALLRPWLRQEPELELKLGFLRSQGIAKNLSFDPFSLNQLLDDSSSFSFTEFRVDELRLRVSNWSFPAFTIEVDGLHVTLTLGEGKDDGGVNQRGRKTCKSVQNRRKILSEVDPEGSALNDAMQIISDTEYLGNWTTYIQNAILAHCHLQMGLIHLVMQYPISNNFRSYVLDIEGLEVEAQVSNQGFFLGGIVSSLVLPSTENYFALKVTGLTIGLKSKDSISNNIFSSAYLRSSIRLKDLQLININFSVPEIQFAFSPLDIFMITEMNKVPAKEYKCARNGMLLWRIAASRMDSLLPAHRWSFHKVVNVICLWVRYVRAYDDLLSLVGYPLHDMIKRSVMMMSRDKKFSIVVKQQWKAISEIEREIPVEAVVLARRLVRCRAATIVNKNTAVQSAANSHFKIFQNMLQLLALVWSYISSIFYSIKQFFLQQNYSTNRLGDSGHGIISDNACPQRCFSLNITNVAITISPEIAFQQPIVGRATTKTRISYSDLLSLCISVNTFIFIYKENICEQILSFSIGNFKVISSSVMKGDRNNYGSYPKGREKKFHDSMPILWGQPTNFFDFAENILTSPDGNESPSVLFLGSLVKEMLSTWKSSCTELEDCKILDSERPFILFEMKSFLTNQGLNEMSSGLGKCCLVVGELNFILGYSSILSIALLLKQINDALRWSDSGSKENVPLHTPLLIEDAPTRNWDGKYKSFVSGIEIELYKIFPEKHFQIGVFIGGPQMRVSLKNELFCGDEANANDNQDNLYLVINLSNIEFATTPSSVSNLASSLGDPSMHDVSPGFPGLKEPEINYNLISDKKIYGHQVQMSLSGYLKVDGLNVYLDDPTEKQQLKIIVWNPTTINLSSIRKELHSLGATAVAFSTALHWITTDLAVLLFVDELSIFAEAVVRFTHVLSSAIAMFDVVGYVNSEDSAGQRMVQAHSESTRTSVSREKMGNLIPSSRHFVINCTSEIKSMDILIHKSRKSKSKDCINIDTIGDRKLAMHEVHSSGVCISIRKSCIKISYNETNVEILSSFSVFRAAIFEFMSEILNSSNQFDISNSLLHSINCLQELFISDGTLSLWLVSLQNDPSREGLQVVDTSVFHGKISSVLKVLGMTTNSEGSSTRSSSQIQEFNVARQSIDPVSSHWIFTNIALGETYFGESSVKDILFGAHKLNKLDSSLSVGGDCQKISCHTQGGLIFLDAEAVVKFLQCYTSYQQCIKHLFHVAPSHTENLRAADSEDMVVLHHNSGQERQFTHQMLDFELTISLSESSLVLVARDESGTLQEFLMELDVHLNNEIADRRKFLFCLSHLSILSRNLHETVEQGTEIQISQSTVVREPTIATFNDPSLMIPHMDGVHSVVDNASCSSPSISPIESNMDKTGSHVSHLSMQAYILKQFSASFSFEKSVPRDDISSPHLNQHWVGGGSLSGFDMTISLREIKLILSAIESLSALASKETAKNTGKRYWSRNQEPERSFEEIVPDGAIVALQDINQHMYITVEGDHNSYSLVGALHYSVVEERALFRVKYHYQRRWGSPVLWFSLSSLYAKNDSGEPLRLNCRSGSGFIDISSTSDSGWALWRILPAKLVTRYGDTEVESYSPVARNMFHLVNMKNDCAVAFVDGTLECVSKPGNPFKWKVFQDLSVARDTFVSDRHPMKPSGMNRQQISNLGSKGTSEERSGSPTCISVEVNKFVVTIVHEFSDAREKIPLLQGSIIFHELIVQILHAKTRIMSRLDVMLYYFDAQRNLWRELLQPAELNIFYRYRFQTNGSEMVLPVVPVNLYAGIKQVDISITEVSLDVLLFVIGKLDLAGPFDVRSCAILANCCKVDNQSGLILHCHFDENLYASVARNQSSVIFLRHLALANQSSDSSIVMIQLTEQGSLLTSPICVSLLDDRTFAWRTRIVSSQDSKTYPGPIVVAQVSQKRGEGLSLVVSPLLRIHNETDFSMELCFKRPQRNESDFASMILKSGDVVNDSMAAFDAIKLSGGSKKALMSLSVGNFLFSFRPEIADNLRNFSKLHSVEWSDDFKGEKAIRLSGLFDKLGYKVRKALSVESVKCSLSTASCSLNSEDGHLDDLYFLIQNTGRDVPVIQHDSSGYASGNRNSPVAILEQKEIFILPTIQISNLLQSEIKVSLSDRDPLKIVSGDNIGKQAIVPSGSTVNLYANPSTIYFTVTLTALNSSCKPVNSADWVKKLQKQNNEVNSLDIELDFGRGKYFAFLRLAFKKNGILEAGIFTSYTLKNDTDFFFFCSGTNHKPVSRDEAGMVGHDIPTELGSSLPAKSTSSWFMKYNKVSLLLLDSKASDALLDLDALSGSTEIDLEVEGGSGCKYVTKLGVSLRPSMGKVVVPSQIVSINPRYIVSNESEESINIRQCHLEDDMQGIIAVNSKQRTVLQLLAGKNKKREIGVFENFLRNRNGRDDLLLYVQFQLQDSGFDWSGPVCVTSLGRFFLKFRRVKEFTEHESNHLSALDKEVQEFASVHVIEEDSTLVLHFNRPPNTSLPYRIENCLEDASITYYQKGSSEPEILGAGGTIDYVWDDLSLPHKLVVQINDVHLLREINLDKVRAWKAFYRVGQQRGLGFQLPLDRKSGHKKSSFGQSKGIQVITSGYEIYTDGLTRVLRICELSENHKANTTLYSGSKMQLRVSNFAIRLLDPSKERDSADLPVYTPIVIVRLGNVYMDSLFNNQRKYNQIRVQSLCVDEKWEGAPFASMIRRHQSEYHDTNDSMLHIIIILLSTSSEVKQVEYSSIVLQPLYLNLDEETLMRIVPFWRASLSDPNSKSQQYYFDHFEIHPIKIIASFLPGESYSSYSSTQEMLRSLLHSVIKVPAIKNKTVELNGVLVTHALITIRELSIKCAQHYSWYAMRAIYIAKGSPLLPPAFASIFDDSASSSLDVFFDPSSGLISLPGLTIGTFKLISKCIDGKGFSGTKRYFGDLGKSLKTAGSNVLFAAVTEISDTVLKGAETNGFNGMVTGFHQGILKLAMEPAVLGSAFIEGGPDRKIKLDRNPGIDELYIEGYLQAMLDAIYKQEYLRVRVIDDQVLLKNLPPNSSLIEEIVDRVKSFLVSKALLKGDSSASHPLRHLRRENDWKIGPTVLTLCEHLFVSFMIRALRNQAGKVMAKIRWKKEGEADDGKAIDPGANTKEQKGKLVWSWGLGKFVLSGVVAYLDGRLCRRIPNPIARRIVSGFLLTFLDKNDQ